jgi:carbamoyl-phosphate synthase large subunit
MASRPSRQVVACDASADAPALQEADKAFVVPPVNRADYFDILLAICQRHQVRLLIPLNDLELPLLARQRERFLDIEIIPVVSSPDVVDICFDKWATFGFLKSCGLAAPKTYPSLAEGVKLYPRARSPFPW